MPAPESSESLYRLSEQCAANPCVKENKPCSEDTESDEASSGCESSSHGTDSDDPKFKIVINIKEGSSSSSCQEDTSSIRRGVCESKERQLCVEIDHTVV
ncbi:hypothetical protein DPMN_186146 [Dreissena polymorpha]|uniref:Uncharacterized protein n=1 Tax=Dreissena polymorpha TaxID=45954 RepID=A0A9D4DPY5_DREPO|nr:hypothetical protein DPMN_186146 [Dreissena polymorpha]